VTTLEPTVPKFASNKRRNLVAHTSKDDDEEEVLQIGDRVMALVDGDQYLEASIIKIYNANGCRVEYAVDGSQDNLSIQSIQRYRPIVEGDDSIEIESDGDWYPAIVTRVHPLGTYDVDYMDGSDPALYLPRDAIRFATDDALLSPPLAASHVDTRKYMVGQHILGNYDEYGEWFDGYIARVNRDGTYRIHYSDGDVELEVTPEFIRPRM
jgi:hypothetical protein